MGDGSICSVILDCHLHDWRPRAVIAAAISKHNDELRERVEKLNYHLGKDSRGKNVHYLKIDDVLSLLSSK